MSLWQVAGSAAIVIALARVTVPPRLRGRPEPTGEPKPESTSTIEALVLLAECIGWAVLVAQGLAIGTSIWKSSNFALSIHAFDLDALFGGSFAHLTLGALLLLPIVGMLAVAVILVTARTRAHWRLERQIAKLCAAAERGELSPLAPTAEMREIMGRIQALDADIVAIAGQANLQTELDDLRAVRAGLIEDFVDADLAQRIRLERAAVPPLLPERKVGLVVSGLGFFMRDRLLGLFPRPAALIVVLGGYSVVIVAASVLARQPDVAALADRLRDRVVSLARIDGNGPPKLSIDESNGKRATLFVSTAFDTIVSPEGQKTRSSDDGKDDTISKLRVMLEAIEDELRSTEIALEQALVEQQWILEEAEANRETDVAETAADAQLEQMALEAAMALEAERTRQQEAQLVERTAKLKATEAALRAERARLVSLIEERRLEFQDSAPRPSPSATEELAVFWRPTGTRVRSTDVPLVAVDQLRHAPESAGPLGAPAATPDATTVITSGLTTPGMGYAGTPRRASIELPTALTSRLVREAHDDTSSAGMFRSFGPLARPSRSDALDGLSADAQAQCEGVLKESAASAASDAAPDASPTGDASTMPIATARALLDCGRALMLSGDMKAARIAFGRVAGAGIAKGALALGTTYDPHALAKANLDPAAANTRLARFWYRRALSLSRD